MLKTFVLSLLLATGGAPNATQEPAWHQFSSNEGGFAVSLPDTPQPNTISTYTPRGMILTHTVSASDNDLNSFMVSWTEYDDDRLARRTPEKLFDKVRDALVLSREGRLLGESAINLDGHPGRAFAFETPEKSVSKVRVYVVRDKFYQVMTESKSWSKNTETGERFFNSFKLLAWKRL